MRKTLALVALVVTLLLVAPHAFAAEENGKDDGRVTDLLIER
jgi:hypothetical protein